MRTVRAWFPPDGRLLPTVILTLLLAGCSKEVRSTSLIDPDSFGSDQGTLVSIGDVRTVAQEMITSMNASENISRLRAERKPLKILVGDFKQRTSITIFDKRVFLNRLLSNLNQADTDGAYAFILRDSVLEERQRQATGEVQTTGPGMLAGAEFVLSGELREIFHQEVVEGGGELEKRTVQYMLALDAVEDGRRLWLNAHEVVKQQVTGAVYR